MQIERRQNPYPFTWEIPAGILVGAGFLLVCGVHLGRGLANWFAAAGWHWPTPVALFSSLPAILGGDAGAGLAVHLAASADPAQLLGWVTAVEVVLIAGGALVGAYGLRRWGPRRLKGMATPAEAEAALGASRLRRVRHIIRPDRYPSRHTSRQETAP